MALSFRAVLTKPILTRALVHQMRKVRWIGFTMMVPSLLLLALEAAERGIPNLFNVGSNASLGTTALMPLVLGCVFAGMPYFSAHQAWKKNPRLADPVDWVVDESMVQVESEFARMRMPWDKFDRVEILKDMILLYPQQAAAYVVAREYLRDEADWNQLRAWCQPKVRKPKFWNGPMKALVIWIGILAVVFLALRYIPAN